MKGRERSGAGLGPRERWILAVLAEAPLHGYALMKRVRERSEGAVRVGPATLYRTLDALHGDGLVEPEAPERVGERPRHPWRITPAGRDALRAEAGRLESTAARLREALGS